MDLEELLNSTLRAKFEDAARAAKLEPAKLLAAFMIEFVEIELDKQLDDAIAQQGIKSGYTEDDAVQLVRQARREWREKANAESKQTLPNLTPPKHNDRAEALAEAAELWADRPETGAEIAETIRKANRGEVYIKGELQQQDDEPKE